MRELDCPSLWIAGARDRLVPWQAMQAAASIAPRGTYTRIEGGGHAPFIGHPDSVFRALDRWLANTTNRIEHDPATPAAQGGGGFS